MPSLSRTVAKLERVDHTGRKRKQKLEFLRRVNVIDFLERLEVANISQATSDEVLCSCPFPGHSHGDEKPSLYMNDGSKDPRLTTVWKCHGCGRQGNAVSFVAEHEHITRQQAAREIKQIYAPGFVAPKGGTIAKEFDQRWEEYERERAGTSVDLPVISWRRYDKLFKVAWNEFAETDDPDVQYMFERGFTMTELEELRIGYDHYTDRIVIPVVNQDGDLVGVKGRAWRPGAKPKYLIIGDKPGKRPRYGFQPYEKSLVVFGLDKWGEQERYVFVEGEIDVMSLWKMGIPALCTGGASMSVDQAKLIRQYANEIVLFLDNDTAGSHGVWGFEKQDGEWKPGIMDLLEPHMRVKVVGPHKFDANDYLRKGKVARVHRLIERADPSYLAAP